MASNVWSWVKEILLGNICSNMAINIGRRIEVYTVLIPNSLPIVIKPNISNKILMTIEIVDTLNGIKLLITIDKPETDPIDKLLGIIKKKTDIEIIKVPSVIIIKSIIFSLVNILITDIKYIIINELWEYILVILDSEHAK